MGDWFYSYNNKQEGPVNDEVLMALATAKLLNSKSLVWKYGMQNWQLITQTVELANVNEVIRSMETGKKPSTMNVRVGGSDQNRTVNLILGFLRGLFTHKGRLRRLHYDLRILLYTFGFIILEIFIISIGNPDITNLINLFWVPLSVYLHIVWHIRRLHDMNKPAHYALLLLIPFFNIYLIFRLWFSEGIVGPNRYGEDPKRR